MNTQKRGKIVSRWAEIERPCIHEREDRAVLIFTPKVVGRWVPDHTDACDTV